MSIERPSDPPQMEARIAELEADVKRHELAARTQSALYRIAAMAAAADDMLVFYQGLHDILSELLDAENMFVALYDEERRVINWPFYRDSVDTATEAEKQAYQEEKRETLGG